MHCFNDLKNVIESEKFQTAIILSFERYNQIYGVNEALEDLFDEAVVEKKVKYVMKILNSTAHDSGAYADMLQAHSDYMNPSRNKISRHNHNWFFELSLYALGLNSSEDVQKKFQAEFERSGHRLRPHAPFGDIAATVIYLLQGIDVCTQWNEGGNMKTLTKDQFRRQCWVAVGSILASESTGIITSNEETIKTKYLQNKSYRIISANLHGFEIIVEHLLEDSCYLKSKGNMWEVGGIERRNSWLTDMISKRWNGRPLQTWLEGASKDKRWLIKIQSAQDGHEADKTKELAGRARGMRVCIKKYNEEREHQVYEKREMPKIALLLDGDWAQEQIDNLYESGWDWVGGAGDVDSLLSRIKNS